jgi:FlaA1/EpsC-like NDP-sugar epimerase
VIIGLRPGEKLHEELLIEPGMLTTPHEKILRVQERSLTPMQIASALKELRSAAAVGDAIAARRVVETYVEDFGSRAKRAGRVSQA